jgi:CheY-like chemotaxis protein
LLTFARQSKPMRNNVNIKDIIQNTLDLRAYHLRTNNIQVSTEFDPDLPVIVADPGQLQQVFLNIIINAEVEMKTAHGKGKLRVKAENKGDTILISFKDSGRGIAPENIEKIFDPFFTTREVGSGTGLGLSICLGIISEHGGTIWVESKPGKGATFFVELPVNIKPEQLQMADSYKETAKEAMEMKEAVKTKILVLDDEEIVRDFLNRILTKEGYQVDIVDNAEAALEKIKSEKYRLILLDIKMPGTTGIELYQRIKKIDKSLIDKIVFVTGDVMGADTELFLRKTKAPYITKPFFAEQLKKFLGKYLS